MRFIVKQVEPNELAEWRSARHAIGQQARYQDLVGAEKLAIRTALRNEQRGLCAYTGISLLRLDGVTGQSVDNFHIEHLKPQHLCTDAETISWDNLVAAHDGQARAPFGAVAKGGWYEASEFTSPLDPDCETHYEFAADGRVQPLTPEAASTISHLRLDHKRLEELRRAAIDAFLDGDDDIVSVLSALQNEHVVGTSDLIEFEFVVRSALSGWVESD